MMQLTGEIPGLLRRSTPVVDRRRFYSDGEHAWQGKPPHGIWSPQGPKADEGMVLWDRSAGQRQRVEERVYAGNLLLDSEDATGRFHCREWLRDRGHDVGNEDRAEVLAWSVLSVWRGGKPLRGVANADAFSTSWNQDRLDAGWALTNPDSTLTLPPLPGAS